MGRLLLCLTLLSGQFASAETLRVLSFAGEPSQFDAFLFLKDGKPTGIEYEILKYFASVRGDDLEIIWVESFEDLLPMLKRGEADIAAATLTITPEREASFDFSEPYFPTQVVLIEPMEEKTEKLDSLASSTVAMMKGTSYEKLLSAIPDVKFVYADSTGELLELVATGKARATATDSALALPRLKDSDSLHVTLTLKKEKGMGFALRKGSPLTVELNTHLQKLRSSGIYFRLLRQFFGDDAVRVVQAGKDLPESR